MYHILSNIIRYRPTTYYGSLFKPMLSPLVATHRRRVHKSSTGALKGA